MKSSRSPFATDSDTRLRSTLPTYRQIFGRQRASSDRDRFARVWRVGPNRRDRSSEKSRRRRDGRRNSVTYVPARNTIFLSYALAWAEVIGAHDIFIGVNALDYSGYPDCRPEFIASIRKIGASGDESRSRRKRPLSDSRAANRDDEGTNHSRKRRTRRPILVNYKLL